MNRAIFILITVSLTAQTHLVAYCMIRHFQPRLIIEVGSGFSSLVAAEAIAKNSNSALICIEPFPQDFLRQGFPGLQSLIEKKVEDIDLEFFSQLHSGDILFIDSSHTVKIGGDVNYLFLEVLPRLKPGVIVHIHDIFLPFEYRRDWVMDEFRFWTEQYLLQAFLTFNSEFEVLMANGYLATVTWKISKRPSPIHHGGVEAVFGCGESRLGIDSLHQQNSRKGRT